VSLSGRPAAVIFFISIERNPEGIREVITSIEMKSDIFIASKDLMMSLFAGICCVGRGER